MLLHYLLIRICLGEDISLLFTICFKYPEHLLRARFGYSLLIIPDYEPDGKTFTPVVNLIFFSLAAVLTLSNHVSTPCVIASVLRQYSANRAFALDNRLLQLSQRRQNPKIPKFRFLFWSRRRKLGAVGIEENAMRCQASQF
jgi:hypothetical protein